MPSLKERIDRLSQLREMLLSHKQVFRDSMAVDFTTIHPRMVDMMDTRSVLGYIVAHSAAKNLVPVTLELGGKNPAVFANDGVT